MKKYITILLLAFSGLAFGADDYKCTVKNAGHINPTGKLENVQSWDFYIDKEFTVERKSGVISGRQFKNNLASTVPQVYDHEVNGYVVVTSSYNQVINYLQINNFEKELEKPFIYIMTNVVLTGKCTEY